MDDNLRQVVKVRLERTREKLEQNGMPAFVVDTAAEVAPLVKTLLPAGATVASGGSMTLEECGVVEMLKREYNYLDRSGPDKVKVEHDTFTADAYLASANAVTEAGEVYEIDGNGNRVAAIAYGPESVILVAGCNKLVPTLEDARRRRGDTATPANCNRLGLHPPCTVTGSCSNCRHDDRICCLELVLYKQRNAGRIKVILVAEALGY